MVCERRPADRGLEAAAALQLSAASSASTPGTQKAPRVSEACCRVQITQRT